MKKIFFSLAFLVSVGMAQPANAQEARIDMSSSDSLIGSLSGLAEGLSADSLELYAYQQALAFLIFDYELVDAVKTLEAGGVPSSISRQAEGLSLHDLYTNAGPYWQHEADLLRNAMESGQLQPGVSLAKVQARISQLDAMMSLGDYQPVE
tara:strand:- start:10998 stop:11450 length:453 start_codon:yes stop_codon:yes gene_type:complete